MIREYERKIEAVHEKMRELLKSDVDDSESSD